MVDAIISCPNVLIKSLLCVIFKLVKHNPKSEVIHSGHHEKLKNNSLLGRLYDWDKSESKPKF